MLIKDAETEAFEAALRRHQKSPEEVSRIAAGMRPFSYEEWQRIAPPATAEELADWEEFLRQRDAEREASLAREAAVEPEA